MLFWVDESIIDAGELGKMAPLGPANFAVRRALIRPLTKVMKLLQTTQWVYCKVSD